MTGAAAKVYLVLAAHNNKDGCCRPGMRRIARLTGLHIGTVSEAVLQLEIAGLITTSERKNGASITYTMLGTVRPEANGNGEEKRSARGERSKIAKQIDPSPDRSGFEDRPFGFSSQTVRAQPNETEEQKVTDGTGLAPCSAPDKPAAEGEHSLDSALFGAVARCFRDENGRRLNREESRQVAAVAANLKCFPGSSPAEIKRRWAWMITKYPGISIHALPKHWQAAGRCLGKGSEE